MLVFRRSWLFRRLEASPPELGRCSARPSTRQWLRDERSRDRQTSPEVLGKNSKSAAVVRPRLAQAGDGRSGESSASASRLLVRRSTRIPWVAGVSREGHEGHRCLAATARYRHKGTTDLRRSRNLTVRMSPGQGKCAIFQKMASMAVEARKWAAPKPATRERSHNLHRDDPPGELGH